VVIRRGVAGLADAVPRFIILSKGEVCRTLLENRKVKGTVNVPCFFPDEAQVKCFYISVGICGHIWSVRVMTGPAINNTVSVNYVIANTAHAFCLPAGTVAALAYGLLLFPPGNINTQHAVLKCEFVAVGTVNSIARVMRWFSLSTDG
jgi:hypothetical protein